MHLALHVALQFFSQQIVSPQKMFKSPMNFYAIARNRGEGSMGRLRDPEILTVFNILVFSVIQLLLFKLSCFNDLLPANISIDFRLRSPHGSRKQTQRQKTSQAFEQIDFSANTIRLVCNDYQSSFLNSQLQYW